MLAVGPESAGSVPGPACYGNGGTRATVTDANVFLGRLNPDNFLGGEMKLDRQASARVIGELATRLGQSPEAIAIGIIRLATLTMASSVRMATLERGFDPSDFAMVAYGGAGPLHAASVAREMGIRRVIIPGHPGHFCAFGMLFADLRSDLGETVGEPLAKIDAETLERRFAHLSEQGTAAMRNVGATLSEIRVSRFADMRYQNQEHTLKVRLDGPDVSPAALREMFEDAYKRRYGRFTPALAVDLVNIRVSITGLGPRPEFRELGPRPADAVATERPVFFDEGFLSCKVWQRDEIAPDVLIEGPAVIEEKASTTIVHPGDTAKLDVFGNIHIEIGGTRR
jgi:N-methylhydantoinase A